MKDSHDFFNNALLKHEYSWFHLHSLIPLSLLSINQIGTNNFKYTPLLILCTILIVIFDYFFKHNYNKLFRIIICLVHYGYTVFTVFSSKHEIFCPTLLVCFTLILRYTLDENISRSKLYTAVLVLITVSFLIIQLIFCVP